MSSKSYFYNTPEYIQLSLLVEQHQKQLLALEETLCIVTTAIEELSPRTKRKRCEQAPTIEQELIDLTRTPLTWPTTPFRPKRKFPPTVSVYDHTKQVHTPPIRPYTPNSLDKILFGDCLSDDELFPDFFRWDEQLAKLDV